VSRPPSKPVALFLVAVSTLGLLAACTDDEATPPAPVAGIIEGSDLPGTPKLESLAKDTIPLNGCHLDGSMSLQERADHTQFVQYTLGYTVVSSFLYTYENTRKLREGWDFLVNGQKRCVGGTHRSPRARTLS
jgi:hypothetical protein